MIAFVGKEAYRGAFGERPALGLQERRLGETRLFVLPSTSPANAAVPWDERLRWFARAQPRQRFVIGVRRSRPKAFGREPDAGRGLAALVLGPVDQRERALDDVSVEPVGRELLARAVLLDVGLEHAVEGGVGRQRVLVELVVAQLGARGALDDRRRGSARGRPARSDAARAGRRRS